MKTMSELIQQEKKCRFEKLYEFIIKIFDTSDEEDFEDKQEKTLKLGELIQECCKDDIGLIGDVGVLHNVSVELAKHDYYDFACNILEKGLSDKKYYLNIDLLADYLKYAIYSTYENLKKADKYYERLKMVEKGKWNWRAFDFSIDYLLALSEMEDVNRNSIFDEALELALIYKRLMKGTENEDKAYHTLAEVYLKRGERKKFETIIKEGIQLKNAPLCTLKWAEYLFDKGEYVEAKKYIIECCRMNTEIDSKINLGYPYILSALSRIMVLYNDFDENEDEQMNEVQDELNRIDHDYNSAKMVLGESEGRVKNLKVQIDILKNQLNQSIDDYE